MIRITDFMSGIFPMCFFIVTTLTAIQAKNQNVVFVILSQSNSFHQHQANAMKESVMEQAKLLNLETPVVHLVHQEWPDVFGAWTIFPILYNLVSMHSENASWLLVTEEFTRIHVKQLFSVLQDVDQSQDWFFGYPLHDNEATIIHHFAFHDDPHSFLYPDFAAGFLMSVTLLKKAALKWMSDPLQLDFSIDPQHELALFLDRSLDVRLTPLPQLCLETTRVACATTYSIKLPNCGPPVPNDEIYFAVKTCAKFHSIRVPIVKSSWAKHAAHVGFFSDKADSSIPTWDVKVPNTEKGHCAKLMAILEHVISHPNIQMKSWLVVADDDTLFSVHRLRQLLSCYNPTEFIIMGERYGYGVTNQRGYNYVTGGGGIVFSMALARHIVESDRCVCPSNDTPDDMYLGICLKRLKVPIIHSPLFHQARPNDYAQDYLSHQEPVSFHKHWLVDPLSIYKEWFADSDQQQEMVHRHLEL